MGVAAGLRHARKHLAAYVDRVAGKTAAEMRRALVTTASPEEAGRLIDLIFAEIEPAKQEIAA